MEETRDVPEVVITGSRYGEPKLQAHHRELPGMKATLAMALVERWGLIAGTPDGEDAAGRAKIRPYTPDELVARAVDTADKTIEELRKRNWFVTVPTWPELSAKAEDEADAAHARAEARYSQRSLKTAGPATGAGGTAQLTKPD